MKPMQYTEEESLEALLVSGYIPLKGYCKKEKGNVVDYVFPANFGSRPGTFHFSMPDEHAVMFEKQADFLSNPPKNRMHIRVAIGAGAYTGLCLAVNSAFGPDSGLVMLEMLAAIPFVHESYRIAEVSDKMARLEHQIATDLTLIICESAIVKRSDMSYDKSVIMNAIQS